MTWFDVSESLPPLDIPIIALWSDGAEASAVLRDWGDTLVWETEHPTEALPIAWRFAEPEAHGLVKKHLAAAWWLPAMAVLAGGMMLLANPLLGGIAIAAILAMWVGYAVLQSAGEAVAVRHGVLLGAVVAMTPTLLALAVGLFFIIRVLQTP